MFGNRDRKNVTDRFPRVLNAYLNSVEDSLGHHCDRDVALMFLGWLHGAAGVLAQRGKLGREDIVPIQKAAEDALAQVVPNNCLGPMGYVDSQRIFQNAVNQVKPGQHIIEWVPIYYAALQPPPKTDLAIFYGGIGREFMAVLNTP